MKIAATAALHVCFHYRALHSSAAKLAIARVIARVNHSSAAKLAIAWFFFYKFFFTFLSGGLEWS